MPVPRLLGGPEPIRDAAGQERVARMMTFLDGTPLDATARRRREREQVGEMLAALRHALGRTSSTRPSGAAARGTSPTSPTCTAAGRTAPALLRAGLRALHDASSRPHVPGLRRQVLHNDFSRSNLIVDHDDPAFVTGVIDFGDTVHTAIAIDVSTALLNQLPPRRRRPVRRRARTCCAGICVRADLTRRELELLPHLVMGRVDRPHR